MYTRRMLYQQHKTRSGMATVLGMLIFIGVLFTSVIPLFLYVNQVNSIYDQTVVQMKRFDEDRQREQIDAYAYPVSDQPDNTLLNVYIKNRSPFSVEVVRVWVNDQPFPVSSNISGMEYDTIESIDIQDLLPQTEGESESFNVKVTTTRGNTFSSATNPLYFTNGTSGGWSGGKGFAIHIVIEVDIGVYYFHIKVTDSQSTVIYEEYLWMILESSTMRKVDVGGPDTYHVEIIQTQGPDQTWSTDVTITPDEPSQWVYPPADYW